MNFLIVLSILTLACAAETFKKAALYLITPEGSNKISLGIDGNKLVSNNQPDTFHLYDSGAFLFPGFGSYLSVTNSGQIELDPRENSDFGVKYSTVGDAFYREITYKGDKMFQLCRDGSIRYRSNCDVLRETSIEYELKWLYHE